jgi:hypothetical protein
MPFALNKPATQPRISTDSLSLSLRHQCITVTTETAQVQGSLYIQVIHRATKHASAVNLIHSVVCQRVAENQDPTNRQAVDSGRP